jgi:hypothetical protein
MSSIQLANITFDCADALRTARFWSAVLDRPVEPGASPFFAAIKGNPNWLFINVPEPKTAKSRVHVDLASADRDAAVARLVELGATLVADKDEWGHRWTVLHDPEGHEFCLAGTGPATEAR